MLFVDADEHITDLFKAEVRRKLVSCTHSGYWLNYSIYFLGKRLKGGYPLRKLALFRVGAGEYERIEEDRWSHLDMEIHEHPVLEGSIGVIESKIDHRDNFTLESYISKHIQYANWEAARFLQLSSGKKGKNHFTWKQKIKYRIVQSPLAGTVFFFGSYFMMGGFRDGARGIMFALLKMNYFNQIYCQIREGEMRR